MTEKIVSETRTIAAPAEIIFDVLADPARHVEIDGSDTVQQTRMESPERLSLDAKFGMKMKFFGLPYRISNVVVEFSRKFKR